MSIEEVGGGDTATRLGIRSFSGSTLLSDFNFGRGVGIIKNAVNPITGLADINYDYDFSVRLGDPAGTVLRFDLQPANMTNVQTMLAALNTQRRRSSRPRGWVRPTSSSGSRPTATVCG